MTIPATPAAQTNRSDQANSATAFPLAPTPPPEPATARPSRSSRCWLAAALTLGLLGVASLTAAATRSYTPTDEAGLSAAPSSAASVSLTATPHSTSPSGPGPARGDVSPKPAPSGAAPSALGRASDQPAPVAELPDPVWVEATAKAGGIPERVLKAYAGAAIATAATHPDCHLGWNTLAGIGQVETEHGQAGGSTVRPDGVADPTITGPELRGESTARVADTDQGALDDDTTWDRAVGPMQFLPATWAVYAQDGDRDGRADVNDIDDAALGAATLLCQSGGDLTSAGDWIAAITAYNPSADYNNQVAEAATRYAAVL